MAIRLNANERMAVRRRPVGDGDRNHSAERVRLCGRCDEENRGKHKNGKALHGWPTYESMSHRPLTRFNVAVTWTGGRTVGLSNATPVLALMS